jgi:hypothetical protein
MERPVEKLLLRKVCHTNTGVHLLIYYFFLAYFHFFALSIQISKILFYFIKFKANCNTYTTKYLIIISMVYCNGKMNLALTLTLVSCKNILKRYIQITQTNNDKY